jgi:hypothetical protein
MSSRYVVNIEIKRENRGIAAIKGGVFTTILDAGKLKTSQLCLPLLCVIVRSFIARQQGIIGSFPSLSYCFL